MPSASIREQRLHYLEAFEARERDVEGAVAFNVAAVISFSERIEAAALTRALTEVVERHDALRTVFVEGAAGLAREVKPRVDVSVEPITSTASAVVAARPFDLLNGPLFRFQQLDGDRLLVALHQSIGDAHTFATFARALADALAGATPERATRDAAEAWQRARVTDGTRSFWRELLRAPLPILDLPTERARPEMDEARSTSRTQRLDAALTDGLSKIASEVGVGERSVLLAAFFTLLHRLTNQEDLVVGVAVEPALPAELQTAIGAFGNDLALRVTLQGSPSFEEVALRVEALETEARSHDALHFVELLESLHVPRDASRAPVFQASFAWRDDRARAPGGVVSRVAPLGLGISLMDLGLRVTRDDDGMELVWEHATPLFDDVAAAQFGARFLVLLRSICEDPRASITKLSVLPQTERETLLVTWNDTRTPLPTSLYAHTLFQQQALRTPDRVAVTASGRALTYGELDRAASQLARHLSSRGAADGALVGIFLERGVDMVTSLHAILRSGAAYVPIDPEYPADRIALMVEDSKLALVVTRSELAGSLPVGTQLVLLDEDTPAIAAESSDAIGARDGDGHERCYVIYTSGSTGRPKGVEIPHRAFVNFLHAMQRNPGITEDDVLVAVTTLSFDIAGLELFLPLSVGASITIATREQAADGTALAALLRSSNASIMQATPATWRLLLGAKFESRRPLKVLCGGEAFPADLARELTDRFAEVFNMYGPTETTVWSTTQRLESGGLISIGRPIDNTSIYVLDGEGAPTPIGVAGELVIGGLGVAIGYLDRAELTSERFVPDPFSSEPGARMYRTGDLASYRADGAIVYQRRLDHQVKVRGYRIELGEIESVLADHPSVRSAVVIVREDRPGDARLCAYFVPAEDVPTVTDLRKHLKKRLPDFMIPQHFYELSSLPLTPAGKVDRKALPAPSVSNVPRNDRPPATPEEKWLAKVWTEALGVASVAASDHFFDVGGHSLLSMTVIAKVERDAGHRFRPRDLLHASLAELAKDLEGKLPTSRGDAPVSARPKPAERPSPSTPPPGFLTKLRSRFFGK